MNPDYERLYHLLNRRRGQELELLDRCHKTMMEALLRITEAKQAFIETDQQAERCAVEQEEPEIVHGTEAHPDRRPG